MKELVDQLKRNRTLSPEELRLLLTDASPEEREYLHRAAREVARVHFGNGVFVRGLIEISNYCRNDCRYCGIRRSNRLAERYRLTPETVLACCEEGYRLGFRTFVLQSGEDPALNDELLTGLIREMRRRWPDCASGSRMASACAQSRRPAGLAMAGSIRSSRTSMKTPARAFPAR